MEQSNFPANNKDCNNTEFPNLRVEDFIEIFYRLTFNFAVDVLNLDAHF